MSEIETLCDAAASEVVGTQSILLCLVHLTEQLAENSSDMKLSNVLWGIANTLGMTHDKLNPVYDLLSDTRYQTQATDKAAEP